MASAAGQVELPDPPRRWYRVLSGFEQNPLIFSLSLILLTVVVYLPVGKNAFINFDDNHYLTDNPHLLTGVSWGTIKWAFTTYYAANWHPLTWLSHALDYQLFGLNPSGHHWVSVLLHALNAVLLFLGLRRLTGFTWRSLMVATLFAVHPLNVESVAWAAERKTLLSTLFFLLAIGAYVSYVRAPATKRWLAVAGLFALALMSKPQAITLPLTLLLLDYWPLGRTRFLQTPAQENSAAPARPRSFSWLVVEKIPLFLLSALSAMVTVHAQRAGNAVRTMVEYSLRSRIENAIISYVQYVGDVFFPYHLAPIYPHPAALFPAWKVSLAGAGLILISGLAIAARRRYPQVLFGWFWFVGVLVPMIGLVQVGMQARADRYMYIPMVGILLAVVWGVAELFVRLAVPPRSATMVSILVSAALALTTFRQVEFWRNSETLWHYALSVTQDNFMAEDNLAQELAHQGRTAEAMVHFQRTLSLYNWAPNDLIMFGVYEQRHGYPGDAIKQYQRALRDTTDASTRAVELSNMGSAYMELKDDDHAEQCFRQALQANPKNVSALIGTGVIADRHGDLDVAIRQYQAAVSVKPTDLGYALLAQAFEKSGQASQAAEAYNRARLLSPDFESTRSTLDHLLAN
jgi:protein O-mannosyl-transferase